MDKAYNSFTYFFIYWGIFFLFTNNYFSQTIKDIKNSGPKTLNIPIIKRQIIKKKIQRKKFNFKDFFKRRIVKSVQNHIKNTNILYGIDKMIFKKIKFNFQSKNIAKENFALVLQEKKDEDIQKAFEKYEDLKKDFINSSFRYHLLEFNKDNKEFSEYYRNNLLEINKHKLILDKFWDLKNNLVVEIFKDHKQTVNDSMKDLFNLTLEDTLKNLRINHIYKKSITQGKNIYLKPQNLFAHLQHIEELDEDMGLALNPAFKNGKLITDDHILYCETKNYRGYEGAGRIGGSISVFSISNMVTINIKNWELDFNWGSKFTFLILPYKSFNIHDFFLGSGIFYLQLPDIFKIFPRGLLEVDIFLGLGGMISSEVGVMAVSSVIFQLKITGLGVLQVEITKNLRSTFQFWNKTLDELSPTVSIQKKLTIKGMVSDKVYKEMTRINISIGVDKQKHKSSLQKLISG